MNNKKLVQVSDCGPWKIAIELFAKFQNCIHEMINDTTKGKFAVYLPNFSNQGTMDFNEDIEKTIDSLNSASEKDRIAANYLIEKINDYIKKTMLPELFKLEIIIIANAFLLKDKPIIDLFYTYTVENERILRKPKDFCKIMNSPFVVLFYKVSGYIFILNASLLQAHNIYIYYPVGLFTVYSPRESL